MINTIAVVLVYAVLNLVVFFQYYRDKRAAVKERHRGGVLYSDEHYDKMAAVKRSGRIPERVLLTLSFIAPFGAVAGMLTFRHKTKKSKFKLVYLFLLLHIVGIAVLVWWYYL